MKTVNPAPKISINYFIRQKQALATETYQKWQGQSEFSALSPALARKLQDERDLIWLVHHCIPRAWQTQGTQEGGKKFNHGMPRKYKCHVPFEMTAFP